MKKKKICFVTTVPSTLRSFILETAKFLYNTDEFDITFVSNYDESFKNNLPKYINYQAIQMKRGISFDGLNAIYKMCKFFKKEKFDLIQYSTPNASLYVSVAAFFARVPVRLYAQWGIVYVGFSGFKRKIFKCIEKLVCTLSTHVQPDSYGNLSFGISENLYKNEKGSVIWNGSACGIKLDKFDISKKSIWNKEIREQYNIDEDTFIYGFVGRINKDKGIDELLEAFQLLEKEKTNVKLILVGSEENTQLLNQELFSWAKSNPNIIFCGRQSDVERYYSALDCYILPSYREGFGMGVIEAEAMGVPVIVSNIPGPTDAMQENVTGLICEKKNAIDLKDKMLTILNKELCLQYGQNAVGFVVDNFEQKRLFEHILENRRSLLNMKRR